MSASAQGTPEQASAAASVYRSESSADFFDAAARGVLLVRRCTVCEHVRAARRALCRRCGSGDFAWLEARGAGTLMSWAANATKDSSAESSPFGLIQLAEGPWLESLLIDTEAADLYEGAHFVVTFVRGPEGDTFPAFRPDRDA